MRAFDPGLALELISDTSRGINVFFGVPSIYQFMAQHPAFATSDFSRLVIGGVGGAPMPVPLLKVWEERGVALQQGYGMTETSPAVLTLGGENVYPAEVENVLHQLAAIAEAAVIGVPHEQWGEVGIAIVAVKSGHVVNEAEIHAHCAANLARFKCPRLIRFVDALPRNATGKIHKPTLRSEFGVPAPIDSAKAKAS